MPDGSTHERLDLAGEAGRPKDAKAFAATFAISRVPTCAGCYVMSDRKGKVIYVGKAKHLRARLRSYLNESDTRYSVKFLMRRVAHIDFLVTRTEKEALLLENSLIKQHRPRYNVRLKDDKTYLSLRLDPREAFPRITVVRRYKRDGARYFGPYHEARAVRGTLRQIRRTFPLRTCSDHVMHNRGRPCLYHQMNQCLAPCVGLVTREAYGEVVAQVLMTLDGRDEELEKALREKIAAHAEKLEFEQAAVLRDRLMDLRRSLERQRTVITKGAPDRDVFGFHMEGRFTEIQILFYRGGKMLGGRVHSFERSEMPVEELLSSFLLQFYSEATVIPAEVLLPFPVDDAEVLAELLTELRGKRAVLFAPQRGEKRALVDLARRNAEKSFKEKKLVEKARTDAVYQVQKALKLAEPPERIECFDISTTQGEKTVASMVTFSMGQPEKSRYRRYAIRTVAGQDDFASMREVLMRRYTRAAEENDLPGLVLIDGGRGQLNVARAVLKDLGLEDIPHVALAKAKTREGGRSPERLFVPGRVNPLVLDQAGPVVQLLARIRDEAHRFAITYHRKRRGRAVISTELTGIPGIGSGRARTLLNEMGSVARIRKASVEEISRIPGFSEKLARTLLDHLAKGGAGAK